jgi:hypothetical protein
VNARELQTHLVEQVLANQNEIAPELMSYVGGDSKEAIDASIERAKTKTQQILQSIRQAQARPSDVDPVWATSNVREGFGDQVDVSAMSMDDYANARSQLIRRSAGTGVGLFVASR